MNPPLPWLSLCLLFVCPLVAAQEKPKTAKLDPAMDVNRAAQAGLQWYNVTSWGVEGRILPDQQRQRWFDRLPSSAHGKVSDNVWNLSRDSAGMMVRFESDSPSIWAVGSIRPSSTWDSLAMVAWIRP